MRKWGLASLAVATVAAGLQSGPALASAFMFIPNGTTPGGLPVEIRIQFADGAPGVQGDQFGGPFSGVTDFLFKIGTFEADLADLKAIQGACASLNPLCGVSLMLDYDLAPDVGSMKFNNTSSDFGFDYANGQGAGYFNTDFVGPQACQTSGVCAFSGIWTQVSEPTTALFLVGGLAVAGMVRRRPS